MQVVAAKWVGRTRCPRCQLDHRFWRCAATIGARLRYGFSHSEEDIGPIVRGVLPRDRQLEQTAIAAGFCPQPAPLMMPEVVFTDGSVLDPGDMLLARGAWAVVWQDGDGWREATGPCPGTQASGRAELQAVLWAAMAVRPPRLVITDSEYVANGVVALLAGTGDLLFSRPHGDLWRLMPPELP